MKQNIEGTRREDVLLVCDDPERAERLRLGLEAAGVSPTIVPSDPVFPDLLGRRVVLFAVSEDTDEAAGRLARWAAAEPDLSIVALIADGGAVAGADALAAGAATWMPEDLPPDKLRPILNTTRSHRESLDRLARDRSPALEILEEAPIGVFELAEGRLSYVNGFMLRRLGYEHAEVIGQRPEELDLLTPIERPLMRRAIEERQQGVGSHEPSVYHFKGKDGALYIGEVKARVVETPDGQRMQGTVRDITFETRLSRLHRIVLELGEIILGEESIDGILQLVLDTITEYAGFRRAVLSLFDLSIPVPFEGAVYRILTSGLTEEENAALLSQSPMSLEERRLAYSEEYRLGSAYYIPHDRVPWADNVGIAGTVAVSGWHRDDYLFIPLRGSEGIIGSISVDDPIDPSAPTVASIEPVASLANIAALAVERTYKLAQVEKQKEHMRGLSAFARELLQANGVRALCEIGAQRLREDMDYEACAIWILEGTRLVKEAGAAMEGFAESEVLNEGSHAYFEGPGLMRWAIKHREPVVVADVSEDDRYVGAVETIRSYISVPIEGRKGTLGAINVASQKVAAFGEHDLEVLTTLAGQLATAISGQRRREALSRIYGFGQHLAFAKDRDQIIATTLDFLANQFEGQFSAILLGEDDDRLRIAGIRGAFSRSGVEMGWCMGYDDGVIGWVAKQKRYAIVKDVSTDPRYYEASAGTRSELAVPVLASGELLGVINVESPQQAFFDEEDRQILEVVANHLAISLSNLASQASLREQAIRDPLTGLYNRHYFNSIAGTEIGRSDRYSHPLSLMMIDIDGFRAVNNRLGHLKGDDVLIEVARMLERNVRSADRVIRYGGDEFLIFMPETNGHGNAELVAARLRAEIGTIPKRTGIGDLDLGLSIGIYTRMPNEERTLESVLEEVDSRMYADKRTKSGNGRDGHRD